MSRFHTPATIVASLLAIVMSMDDALAKPPARSAADRPNILFLVSEDNDPFLGCYGDPFARTPRLDKLAAEGVLYLQAFANAPVCAPSRATLVTGVYASSLGTQHMRSRYPIPSDVRFYCQYLRESGYYCMNPGKTDFNIAGEDKASWNPGKTWKDAPPGKPWMLVLNSEITHESCLHHSEVHPEYLTERLNLPPYHPDTPEIRSNWIEYYRQITKMDAWVGGLLDKLDQDGLADDTIVFYFSDHGGILPRSKRFCLDSGLHVPLIIRFGKHLQHLAPGSPGTKLDRLVSFVDLPPSLLSLAGVPIPPQFQGRAFLGPQTAEPAPYVFGFRNRMDETYDFSRTLRDKQFRYVRNYLPHRIPGQHLDYLWKMPATVSWEKAFREGKCNEVQSAFWHPKSTEELYDEQADPFEIQNLVDRPEHQRTLERMRRDLHELLFQTRDTGFLPESEMLSRAHGSAIREMANDDARYPLARIMDAAELASRRNVEDVPRLIELMRDADAAVRYWAAVGCCMRQAKAVSATESLRLLLKDSSPAVRVAAAEALCTLDHPDEGLPALIAAIDDGDALLALNALDALDALARPAAGAVAAKLARRPGEAWNREYVARKIEWLLIKWGHPSAPAPNPPSKKNRGGGKP